MRRSCHDGVGDPRAQLLQQMQQWLEESGSIVAYFAAFESGRLGELGREFPEHAEWIDGILARVVDLHAPFKALDVYHPSQNGSTSIKAVLPALTGSGYEGMAIADGGTASLAFLRIAFGREASWSPGASAPGNRQGTEASIDVAKVREDLEAYCRLDTLAMVRILDELERLAARLTPAHQTGRQRTEPGQQCAPTPFPRSAPPHRRRCHRPPPGAREKIPD